MFLKDQKKITIDKQNQYYRGCYFSYAKYTSCGLADFLRISVQEKHTGTTSPVVILNILTCYSHKQNWN